jgi:predicted ATPase
MLGIAATRERRYREAQALFDDGLESWERFDAAILVPYLKCVCAQSHAAMDGMTSAFRLLDEALDQIVRPGWGERSHIAEIFRVQGVLHEQIGNRKDAEASLQTSLDWARKQAAKSWELRTSTSLARLWNNQGKRKEALDLLKPVYDWFAEGFDTKDLKEAKALLDDLES